MPMYDYQCNKCKNTFEEMLTYEKRDNPTKEPCPKCGVMEVNKVIGGFPGLAADTNITPDKKTGGDWSELMGRIKKGVAPKYHGSIDKASNQSGRRWKG